MTVKEFKIQYALGLVPENSFLKRCWKCKTKTPHRRFKSIIHDLVGGKGILRKAFDRCIECGSTTYSNKI